MTSFKKVSPKKPKFLWMIDADCPVCSNKISINEYLYEIPLIGKMIISSGECESCKFIYRDVRMADSRGSQILKYKVKSIDDLGTIIIRASSAAIRIPELDVSINPGAASQGFITTIEGVLQRVVEVMKILEKDEEVNKKDWEERMKNILKALEGKLEFTIVIEDPKGVSRILSHKEERLQMYR